jgi:Gram-negative bacterial TonB protein C-terminal
MKCVHTIAAALIITLSASARDSRVTFDLLKKGHELSPSEAASLEAQVSAKPKEEEARIQLLAYYAAPPAGADLAAAKAARAAHILWLIEHDPKDGLGLFQVATGVYRLHCQGDDLADLDAFRAAADLWLKEMEKKPKDATLRRNAVDFIQYCAPEKAEQILSVAKDDAGLGRLYAYAVLGVTGQTYTGNDPAGTNPTLRQSPFAEKARRALDETTDKDFVVAAAIAILRDGGILWADGKLDWDYTSLGNNLLARAKELAPDNLTLFTLRPSLPALGERPPLTLRVGGNVQAANLVKKVTPPYPPAARERRIEGSVQMTALLGLDGTVLKLNVDSGPPELIDGSVRAALQWVYKPTLLNGKRCFVITRIDVNYEMTRR